MVNWNIFTQLFFNIFSITIKLKVTCSCIPNYIPHASEIIFYKTVLFLVLRSSTSYVSKIIQLLKIHWKYYTLLSLTVDRSQNFIFWRTTALLITTWYWLKKLSDNRAKNGEIWLNIEIHILNSCFQNYIATKSSMKIEEIRFENAKWWLSLCYFIYTGNTFKEIHEEASPNILNGISKNEIKDEIITSGIFMADHCLP